MNTLFSKKPLLRLKIIILLLACSEFKSNAQETIQIYHGQRGTTKIVSIASGEKILLSNKHTIVLEEGKEVRIEIINPNPVLYNYKFNKSDLKIEEETLPDISSLVKALSSLTQTGGTPLLAGAGGGGAATPNELNILIAKINTLKSILTQIETEIANSDIPESIKQALDGGNDAGFRKAIVEIKKLFNQNNLAVEEKALKDQLQKVITKNQFPDNDADGQGDPAFEEAFKMYIESLGKMIAEIKTNFIDPSSPDLISFSFKVEQKAQEIAIEIQTTQSSHAREIGNLISIFIVPYKKDKIELVPFYSMLHAKNQIKFEVENSVIVKGPESDFTFRPGFMLAANVRRFGEKKEFSVGPGLGFSIVPKTFDLANLTLGALFRYKDIFRLGLAWGMQKYPSGLKDGAAVGAALPANVSRIEDVIEYSGKSVFMINFSVFGLKL